MRLFRWLLRRRPDLTELRLEIEARIVTLARRGIRLDGQLKREILVHPDLGLVDGAIAFVDTAQATHSRPQLIVAT